MFRWLFIPVDIGKRIMASLDNLTNIAAKLKISVADRMASDALTIQTLTTAGSLKDATIADLQAQLVAFQNDAATIDAAVTSLTETDAAVTATLATDPL